MAGALERFKNALDVFRDKDDPRVYAQDYGPAYSVRPDRVRLSITNERSIIGSIYNRVGIDFSSLDIRHVRTDDEDRYSEELRTMLNDCFSVEANIDQSARAFKQDLAMSVLEWGVAAVVPVDWAPNGDIKTMRIGRILQWYPRHVQVDLYNDKDGQHYQLMLPKKIIAIVENPLYTVMNEPNSTLQRLIRKLNILDAIDEQSGSGKLDIIMQLPYVVKSDARREQADKRRKSLEDQLAGSKYGIGYVDATEKITQLNRPAENNLLTQIEYLTRMLYGQLGLTEEIMNGTADEAAMLNYMNRTIKPLAQTIVEEFRRKFLTKTARTQRQSVMYFSDPFALMPISQVAEIADKFTRNEIASSNEIRTAIGWKPSKDPKADELSNSNMPVEDQQVSEPSIPEGDSQNGSGLQWLRD